MRSSVTVILSDPPPDKSMICPDYHQTIEDHQCLLILVKLIGKQMKQKTFNRLCERIARFQHVQIQDSQGVIRGIWVRYKKKYSQESNEWGDFQAHRKVLGLICIGKCKTYNEFEDLCKVYEATREKYNSTLYDSRCIIYGINEETVNSYLANEFPSSDLMSDPVSPSDGISHFPVVEESKQMHSTTDSTECDSGVFSAPPTDIVDKLDVSESTVQEGAHQPRNIHSMQSPKFVYDGPIKRGHIRNASLPASPSRTSIGSYQNLNFSLPPSPTIHNHPLTPSSCSSETSSTSSHQTLLPAHSIRSQLIFYPSIEENFNLEQDLYDFVCSIFWVLESKRLDKSHEKLDRIQLLCAPFEKKDLIGIDLDSRSYKKRSQGRMKKHIGDLSLLAGLAVDAINCYLVAADVLKSVNDWLWLAGCYEGLCAASIVTTYPRQKKQLSLQRNSSFTAGSISIGNKSRAGSVSTHSLPTGLDPVEYKCKNSLSANEIIEKYKEAILHYSKFNKKAAIVDIEANVKAAKILIHQEKYLHVAEFLQSIFHFSLQVSDEEKLQRFNMLSSLYMQIGFHRKAALFKRFAALKYLAPQQDATPNWSQSYNLLLQTLEGYKLNLDPKTFDSSFGWPVLQIQILHALIALSKKMGNTAVSVRHVTFLLHSMFNHLSLSERREFSAQLEMFTSKCEGGPVPLALDSGYILPPVNLTNLPRVKSFKLQNPAPHLRPLQMSRMTEVSQSGPFIFSPLQMGPHKNGKNKNDNKMDFKWVEGDVCEVTLQVFNPLSFELKVMNMGLLPDGIAFETFPASLSLPAESGPYPVKLLGTPHSTGPLEILGYTTHVFGVKSNCRLRDLPCIKKTSFIIDVVPALPQIQISTSVPKAATFSSFGDTNYVVTSMALNLLAGSSQECTVTMLNCSNENVEKVEIILESRLDEDLQKQFCTWSTENLKTQLPISPENSASFTLYIHAVGDLNLLAKAYPDEGSETTSVSSNQSKTKSNRTSSLGSLMSVRTSSAYSSFRRKISDIQPPSASPSLSNFPTPKVVEMILKIKYTGGQGMIKDYCRQSAIAINVEVSSSLLITKWDVLPAERPTHCYLVLDILNTTDYEMEVHYTTNKQILIEAKETCRIPVPVERCPLYKLIGLSKEELALRCQEHVASLVDLKWTISSQEITGVTPVSNLVWTPAMLSLIRMSPIQWEISLNDVFFKPENDFTYTIGDVVNLSIAISNYSESILNKLCLKIDLYQDYQNGQYNYRLENKLAFVGCDSIIITKIQVRDTYCHQCGLIFLVPGIYKLDIRCSSSPIYSTTKSRSLTVSDVENYAQGEAQTWKCTPVIELTVIEK